MHIENMFRLIVKILLPKIKTITDDLSIADVLWLPLFHTKITEKIHLYA